jgi:hypothetical protein
MSRITLAIITTLILLPGAFADCTMEKAYGSWNSGAFTAMCNCVSSGGTPNTSFTCTCNDGGACTVCGHCQRITQTDSNGIVTTTTNTTYVGCGNPYPPNTRRNDNRKPNVNAFLAQQQEGTALTTAQMGKKIDFATGGFPLEALDPVADVEARKISNIRVSLRNLSQQPITGLLIRWKFEDVDGNRMELLTKVDSLLGGQDIPPNVYTAVDNTQEVRSKSAIKNFLGEIAFLEFGDGTSIGASELAKYFENHRKQSAAHLQRVNQLLLRPANRDSLASEISNLLDSKEFRGSEVKVLLNAVLGAQGTTGVEATVKNNRLTRRY